MKKFIALLLALVMVMSLAACSVEKAEEPAPTLAAAPEAAATEAAPAAPAGASEITLWTYPIGSWGDQATVDALMADFAAATGIKVNVEFLTYADGDDKVNTAIEGGQGHNHDQNQQQSDKLLHRVSLLLILKLSACPFSGS